MKDFERTLLIGVVFDLSTLHSNGTRNLDIVKDVLLKSVLDVKPSSKIYISHPNWHTIPRDQGESTYYVISYQEPPNFYIDSTLKNAVTVVGEYVEDCDKYMFLITDRFQAPRNYQYRKGFLANNIRGYSTKMCIFGIGDSYDNMNLKSLAEEYEAHFSHLSDAASLSDELTKLLTGY